MEKSSFLPFVHTHSLTTAWVVCNIGKEKLQLVNSNLSSSVLWKLSHENDSTIKTNLNWSGRNFLSFWLHFLTPHFLWILSKNLRHRAMNNSQVDIKSFFFELTTIVSSCGGDIYAARGMGKWKWKFWNRVK